MIVTVNGERRDLTRERTVADLVADLPHRGVAVARNGAVVPRPEHARTTLVEGDVIEIVTAVQGG